jgi:hypothetical protein
MHQKHLICTQLDPHAYMRGMHVLIHEAWCS